MKARQGIRSAVAAAVVAAAAAAVLVAAPAMAGMSPRTAPPAGPVIVAGYKTGPVHLTSVNPTTIAALHLTTGSWAIFAKGWIEGGASAVLMDCRLAAGTSLDHSRFSLESASGAFSQTFGLNVVHHFPAGGVVTLSCNSFGASVFANFIKITAIKGGTVTDTQMP